VFASGGVHFVPYFDGTSYHGFALRYDTQADFSANTSWSAFAMGGSNPSALGYLGTAFDGRYLYYAPHYNGAYHGLVARYDTDAAFDQATSWQFYSAANVNPLALGFYGAVYAKGHVYLVPHYNGSSSSSLGVRYNTGAAFDAPTSWTSFDIGTLNASARGFVGGAFDGRYVYYAPYNNGNYHGLIVRYDTETSFTTANSWLVFDAAQVDAKAKGFVGAAFDGRYVYFVPNGGTTPSGTVVRCDIQGDFNELGSWQAFDLTALNSAAQGFFGAVFDGEYLYLIPSQNNVVARFRARSPRATTVPYNGGSFY
jgi:hypothetical protein